MYNFTAELKYVANKDKLVDIQRDNTFRRAFLKSNKKAKMAESVKHPLSYSKVTKILSSVGGKITIPTTSSYIEYCEDAWLLLRNEAYAEIAEEISLTTHAMKRKIFWNNYKNTSARRNAKRRYVIMYYIISSNLDIIIKVGIVNPIMIFHTSYTSSLSTWV